MMEALRLLVADNAIYVDETKQAVLVYNNSSVSHLPFADGICYSFLGSHHKHRSQDTIVCSNVLS